MNTHGELETAETWSEVPSSLMKQRDDGAEIPTSVVLYLVSRSARLRILSKYYFT